MQVLLTDFGLAVHVESDTDLRGQLKKLLVVVYFEL